jgi:hypothetical protein
VRNKTKEEGKEEGQEEEVRPTMVTSRKQGVFYKMAKKKTSKKAGKAAKKKNYYHGKDVRACKSR